MRKFNILFFSTFLLSACAHPVTEIIGAVATQLTIPTYQTYQQSKNGCTVLNIIDGDTFTCKPTNILQRNSILTIRLSNIDAPELDQPFGLEAKEKLENLIYGKTIQLANQQQDKYQRIIADVFNQDNKNINLIMVKSGMAWAYKEYLTSHIYTDAEGDAIIHEMGLWRSENPIYPSDWRRGVREAEEEITSVNKKTPTVGKKQATQSKKSLSAIKNNSNSKFQCGTKRTCNQMRSCSEAQYFLNQCGIRRLDKDNDGVPCESICS